MNTFCLRRSACALGMALAVSVLAPASGRGQLRDQLQDLTILKQGLQTAPKVPDTRIPIPVDAPVNQEEYYVGPGDVFAVNVWSAPPIEHTLTVTPEGSLLIPSVGLIDVRDLTLRQVKEKVVQAAVKKYLKGEVSVTLLTPRKITVQIFGNVINEGTQEIYAVERVDRLMAKSNVFPSERTTLEEYEAKVLLIRQTMSERRVVIRRSDGAVLPVDLARYRVTRDGRFNPYLREGDVVYVPFRGDMDNSLGVYGGKMRAAWFEYVPGDSLSTLIRMAFGFEEGTDPEHAKLTRLSRDGRRMDTVFVDARAVLEGRSPDVALAPGDRLIIPVVPDSRRNYRVTIEGEVNAPGSYPIAVRNTRLSDVIRLAGGFTLQANLRGAMLIRGARDPLQMQRKLQDEQLLSKRSALQAEDSSYFSVETILRVRGETVAVDFERLFVEGDSTQDAILEPYDIVRIPPKQMAVYVFGQVVSPGLVKLEAGKSYDYYIEKSGGYTSEARTGDVMVIKMGTRIWLDPDETSVEDGDFIWVPKETSEAFSSALSAWIPLAAIIGTIATVALTIKAFQ